MPISTVPRGRSLVRSVIAKHLAKRADVPSMAVIGERFGASSWITRAAIGGVESDTVAAANAADEFLGLVTEASLIGRMAGRREVSFNVRNIVMTDGARGYFVGEHRPIPLSKPSLTGETLLRRKVATIVVLTREAFDDPRSEGRVQADMTRAVVTALDEAFIDVANAGVPDATPSSVTSGITPIASSGDPTADLQQLIANFDGDLAAAYLASDGKTFAAMNLYRDSAGSAPFADLGARGGIAAGIPALASRGSPTDSSGGQLALIDPTAIAIAIDGVEVLESRAATLLMSDDPENVAATERVSLFQEEAVALKIVLYVNWSRQRAGAVTVVTGAEYSAS